MAAECAGEQGRFWEYHDTLFENLMGKNVGSFSVPNIIRFGAQVGLDAEDFGSCLKSERPGQRVLDDIQAARASDVRATPTVFINGRRVAGLEGYETYRKIIEEELSKAR